MQITQLGYFHFILREFSRRTSFLVDVDEVACLMSRV